MGRPEKGFRTKGAWLNPVLTYWKKFMPAEGEFQYLFPNVDKNWKTSRKQAPGGNIQAVITRIEFKFGFPRLITTHSPRNFYATCARQLLYSKEERNTLGHWKADSEMCDRYDRAVCATELKLRNSILAKLDGGWRPVPEFEVPKEEKGRDVPAGDEECDATSIESTSETSTEMHVKEERINDITQLYD